MSEQTVKVLLLFIPIAVIGICLFWGIYHFMGPNAWDDKKKKRKYHRDWWNDN